MAISCKESASLASAVEDFCNWFWFVLCKFAWYSSLGFNISLIYPTINFKCTWITSDICHQDKKI